jgi:polyvinyl alcohol dehydrogenase (cytochrome)
MRRILHVAALLTSATAVYFAWTTDVRAQAPAAAKGKQGGSAGTESGWAAFQTRCMGCHGNAAVPAAPSPEQVRQMSPERIYAALTTGSMKSQGDALSEDQRRMLATFMSARPLGSLNEGAAASMPNHCVGNPAMTDPAAGPAWNGWGADMGNTRFQRAKAAGLTAAQVPNLKLKWAFGVPTGLSQYNQPTIVSGRVFLGTDTGYVYSLDAKTGCVYWSFQTKAAVRGALSVGAIKGKGSTKYAVVFGDFRTFVYGLDAQTGQQLWSTRADDHFIARITAAPIFHDGKVYVPISSSEEFQAGNLDYACCTSRGSVVAFDASNGERLWKTYVMDEPKPVRKNSKGVQLYAPAGGSVWNSPTIDTKLNAIYFGTGDAETEPAAKTSDAVMALDLKTGKELWHYQIQENDAFMGGCGGGANKSDNCPVNPGPDLDIGNSPILKTLPDGKRIVLTAGKDGRVFALDPDKKGALLWMTNAAPAPPPGATGFARLGGIVWGGAADDRNVYYGLSSGGMSALKLATGEKAWYTPLAKEGTRVNNAAAVSAIPGVAFVAGSDGVLHALSTADGKIIWEYNTSRDFDTVNKVPAKGGAINSIGPTIVNGMVFIGSGYAVSGNNFGNVLLAFSLE